MNIYCFSTLSFAKLQFKSVINKAFHKHGVASFTDAWIETYIIDIQMITKSRIFYRCVDWNIYIKIVNPEIFCRIFYRCVDWNHFCRNRCWSKRSHLLQMRGLKPRVFSHRQHPEKSHLLQMRGLKLFGKSLLLRQMLSHLLQMRGLKQKQAKM